MCWLRSNSLVLFKKLNYRELTFWTCWVSLHWSMLLNSPNGVLILITIIWKNEMFVFNKLLQNLAHSRQFYHVHVKNNNWYGGSLTHNYQTECILCRNVIAVKTHITKCICCLMEFHVIICNRWTLLSLHVLHRSSKKIKPHSFLRDIAESEKDLIAQRLFCHSSHKIPDIK